MKFSYNNPRIDNLDKVAAFIEGNTLYVKRNLATGSLQHDWSAFSENCGWQNLQGTNIQKRLGQATKIFYPGDTLTVTF